MASFSDREYLRYTRHIQLPHAGAEGQRRLKDSHVLIVGCGGLGAPVSLYLAAAGVGTLTLVDGDTVDLTNLQRQITFSESQLGQAKASCTKSRLQDLNSDITINAVNEYLTPDNASGLVTAADLVLDCSDNFAARYLINDICKALGKPWIYASIYQFSGQCAFFSPDGCCFRCVFPNPPEDAADCNSAGVLGVLPGLLGTLQATEALKFLLKLPLAIENKLMLVETQDMSFHKIQLRQDSNCSCCHSEFSFDSRSSDYQPACVSNNADDHCLGAAEFDQWSRREDIVLVDVRSLEERQIFNLGGKHIPLDELESTATLTIEKQILLYCQSGVRSRLGCETLRRRGFKVQSVSGGIAQILRYRP